MRLTAATIIIADLRHRFAVMHQREPDSDELLLTLAETVSALAQLVSPGYVRWPPGYAVAPPRQQRPQIEDSEPETPSE